MKTIYIQLFLSLFASFIYEHISAQKLGFQINAEYVVTNKDDTLNNPWTGGLSSPQFSNIHLNTDGILDLVVFNRLDASIVCFVFDVDLNSWKHAPQYQSLFPKDINHWVLLRDFDCDGDQDLFSSSTSSIKVYENKLNESEGGFVKLTGTLKAKYKTSTDNVKLTSIPTSTGDIPVIEDLDGDGDLDILTFGVSSSTIQYYKNTSQENAQYCDLEFELKDNCWGKVFETDNDNSLSFNHNCNNSNTIPQKAVEHAGSTLAVYDVDGNQTKDLLIGDVSFSNISTVFNSNTLIDEALFTHQNAYFPNSAPIVINTFPAVYFIDENGAQKMIAAANTLQKHDYFHSIKEYSILKEQSSVEFQYQKNDFLLDEQLFFGQNSTPLFYDLDGDKDQDLFVAFDHQLAWVKNIGTPFLPKFEWVDSNYLDLKKLNFEDRFYPAFGKLNTNNLLDLVIGFTSGRLAWIQKKDNDIDVVLETVVDHNKDTIDVGYEATPTLWDWNKDGLLDLFIGNRAGKVHFYQNVGTDNEPSFQLVNDNWAAINTSEYWSSIGRSAIRFYQQNDTTHILSGSEEGRIYHYTSTENELPVLQDSVVSQLQPGRQSKVTVADLNKDGQPDMVVGNARGGLHFYSYNKNAVNGISELDLGVYIQVFPNPVRQFITVKSKYSIECIQLFSLTGENLKSTQQTRIDVADFPLGMYLMVIECKNGKRLVKKWVKVL